MPQRRAPTRTQSRRGTRWVRVRATASTPRSSSPSPIRGPGQPIAAIEYRLDGGAPQTVNAATKELVFGPREDPYSIAFKVKDADGNWSPTKTINFSVANATSWFSYLSGYQRVSYGRTAAFSGVLKSGDTPLEGQTVILQRLSGRTSGSWIDVTSAETDENGYVRFSVPASSSGYNYTKTYYRLLFAGATGYDGVWTVSRYVDPKVYLSRPWPHKSRVYRKRTYSWYANLKPRHSGKPVKMYFQRYYKGKWRHYTTRYASAYNYSSYSRVKARYAIPYKGRWRVRAYHDDGGHLPTYSSWRYVTVR